MCEKEAKRSDVGIAPYAGWGIIMTLPTRKWPRLNGWDYSKNGLYFLTICTEGKKCILSSISPQSPHSSLIYLTATGEIVDTYIKTIQGIDKYVIMPNHVHVLIEVADGWSLSRILHGWRSFTANEANKILGRTGRFWMEEYFDRYIRDERHFLNVQSYIRMNPVKAGLVADPAAWPWTWEAPGSAGCQPATPTPLHNSPTQDTP